MIRRWIMPALVGIIAAAVAWQVALTQTPRILMAAAMTRLASVKGTNGFVHAPLATERSRAIVRPSPDLAYSSCVLDVSRGPVLVTVPAFPARYWSLSIFDTRTDVAFVRNNIDARGDNFQLLVARHGQVTPPGARVVTIDDAKAVALIRVLIDRRTAFSAIDRARRTAECRPLDG